jgi:hypothetical protein
LIQLRVGTPVQVYGKLVRMEFADPALRGLRRSITEQIAVEAHRVVVAAAGDSSQKATPEVPAGANEALIVFVEEASKGEKLDAESRASFLELLKGMKPANDQERGRIDALVEKLK